VATGCIEAHAAKLRHPENAIVAAHTVRPIEDGAFRSDLDSQCNQDNRQAKHRQQQTDNDDVEESFSSVLCLQVGVDHLLPHLSLIAIPGESCIGKPKRTERTIRSELRDGFTRDRQMNADH